MTGPTRPGDALSDTQRRFLVAIMEQLARDLIHEIHLFAPMKQGGVETGIAVVVLGEPAPLDVEPVDVDDMADERAVAEQLEAEIAQSSRLDADSPYDDQVTTGQTDTEEAAPEPEAAYSDVEQVGIESADIERFEVETSTAALSGNDVHPVVPAAPEQPLRYTIHTARYRLQLKGPERGKWDVDVVEEADAPLVSIDAVVRGVHRRSGEPSEVERLAPHDLARALGEIPWTSEN